MENEENDSGATDLRCRSMNGTTNTSTMVWCGCVMAHIGSSWQRDEGTVSSKEAHDRVKRCWVFKRRFRRSSPTLQDYTHQAPVAIWGLL
ncbi:hypothetical protein SESBI_14750 [Sesbania bispinosa]|nr:hypothetical protein SESBI_14750 [Sesbania bispinosa]